MSKKLDDLEFINGVYVDKETKLPFSGEISGIHNSKNFMKDGKAEGEWVGYHENGQLWHRGNFKDGREQGEWTFYHKNGQLDAKGNYKDGKQEGEWVGYHENGQRIGKGAYQSDEIYLVIDAQIKSTYAVAVQQDFFNFIEYISLKYFKVLMGFGSLNVSGGIDEYNFPTQKNLFGNVIFLLKIKYEKFDQFLLEMKNFKSELNFPYIQLDFFNLIEGFKCYDDGHVNNEKSFSCNIMFQESSRYGFQDKKTAELCFFHKMTRFFKQKLEMGGLYLEYNVNTRHPSMFDLKRVQNNFYNLDYDPSYEEFLEKFDDDLETTEFLEQFKRIKRVLPKLKKEDLIENIDYWVAQCLDYYLHNDLKEFSSPQNYRKKDFQIPYKFFSQPELSAEQNKLQRQLRNQLSSEIGSVMEGKTDNEKDVFGDK